ncbi:MAG TPA: MBL fold metallo-hydrolase [Cyclobacteriaceae bacterium]|nr:MBL fold metallo-hydrolase [Cyclobacteriaceae bacterium]
MWRTLSTISLGSLLAIIAACTSSPIKEEIIPWCATPLRPEYSALKEIPTSRQWFKVYDVGDSVFAIYEPYSFQEVISYLILGKEKALLFDTGNGIDSINLLVKELTALPITVLNSHTHYDHTGGNADFDNVLAMDTAYTQENADNGWSHDRVKGEVTTEAICLDKIPGFDSAAYAIRPFVIHEKIKNHHLIDLGGRKLEVISSPGHTPDAIALLDKDHGLLWTGDMFYEATIWLFFPGTDLDAYEQSIGRFAELVPSLKRVHPAHNFPVADPVRLTELKQAFEDVKSGKQKAEVVDSLRKKYVFEHFSFLMRR